MTVSRFVIALVCISSLYGQASTSSTGTSRIDPTMTIASPTPPPPPDPKILEDGGLSIEPIYWLTQAQPTLYGGSQATASGNLNYLDKSKKAEGVEVGIPAGRADTLRFSYFRVQGNSNVTLGTDQTYFSQAFSSGDYMASTYRLQNAKISWDYLSYTFKNGVRFKTLYEVQFTTISTDITAPFMAITTDASGTTSTNTVHGSKNIIYPTLGAEFEQAFLKHFRWEAKASGFGLPHHSDLWDAQMDVAVRVRGVELLAGGKAYHFKTSENSDNYFADTLQGAFVGVRYYWGGEAH